MSTVTEDLLQRWKTFNSDVASNPNDHDLLRRFTTLLNHVEAIDNLVPIRLIKKYQKYITHTETILSLILDSVDLNDPQVTHLFGLYKAFGNIKIIQMTYHIGEQPNLELKAEMKWFDLQCLLPVKSENNWKNVYSTCFNGNLTNADLFKSVLDLYIQKLRFYAILENLDPFQQHVTILKKSAKELVKKLVKSNYSQHDIRMDDKFTSVIMPYLDNDLYPIISEAVIQDRFISADKQLEYQDLITNQLIENNIYMQTQLMTNLLIHLRNNISRNKRKHGEEAPVSPLQGIIEQVTFEHMSPQQLHLLVVDHESINVSEFGTKKNTATINFWSSIQSACNGASTSLTSKTVQTKYIYKWLNVLQALAKHQYLIIPNRLRIFAAASIVLISTSAFIGQETIEKILSYLSGLIEDLPHKEVSIFFRFIPAGQYLIKLTNCLANNTQIFEKLESCLIFEKFLSLFLNTYMNYAKDGDDSLSDYVAFIVNENLDKSVGTYSQLIVVNEILSTNTCNSRKSTKKSRNSIQLSISPNLLQTVDPCVKRLKSVVAENQQILFSSGDQEDLFASIITRATISIIKLFIIQKNMDALKKDENFLKELFDSIIKNIGYKIQMHQTRHKSKKKMHLHLCDDRFIDLIEFYNRYRTQIESALDLRIMSQLLKKIISTIAQDVDQDDCEKSRKLCKRMAKELKGSVIDESKFKEFKSKNITTKHTIDVEEVCCPDIKRILIRVAPLVFSSCDTAAFQDCLDKILNRILDSNLSDHGLTVRSLTLLESVILASPSYNIDKTKILTDNYEKIIASITKLAKQAECRQSIHLFSDAGVHKSMASVKCCIVARCLTTLVLLYRSNQSKVSKEDLTYSSLQMISYANLRNYALNSHYAYNQFLDTGSIIYSILNECLLKKSVIVLNIMPTFSVILQEFIRCLLIASDRNKLEKIKDTVDQAKFEELEHRFEVLALDTAKIMSQLSLLRSNYIGCAPYLIASYIKDIQIVSSHPRVRLHLNEGIFRIFNQIDAHQKEFKTNETTRGNQRKTHAGDAQGSIFEMIHARLDQSSREIFRDMHANYEKFHRFTGKC